MDDKLKKSLEKNAIELSDRVLDYEVGSQECAQTVANLKSVVDVLSEEEKCKKQYLHDASKMIIENGVKLATIYSMILVTRLVIEAEQDSVIRSKSFGFISKMMPKF